MPRTDRLTVQATPGRVLAAALALRFGEHRLSGHVYWPTQSTAVGTQSPLTFVLTVGDHEDADPLSRLLCSAAGTVVVAVPRSRAGDHAYEFAALGWAVEHATELQADPEYLMIAGEGPGGARAAALAVRARNLGWPRLRRQILVYPTFTQTCPMPSLLSGVAAATILSSDTRIDHGSEYAALLRAADIEVDELRHPSPILPGHDDLSVALAGTAK